MTTAAIVPHVPRGLPRRPFYFNTSAHLLRITREKAETLNELLKGLRSCPNDSIFQHTFRTLQEHHFIREGFSNDFAHWALEACNEPVLAERLASVDVREYTSIADIRYRLVSIVEEYLERHQKTGDRCAHDTFHFCASDIVVVATKYVAKTLPEFADDVRSVSVHSIHHHFIEARLRLKLMSNDFSRWLLEDMGLADAARALNHIDIYNATLEDVQQKIVRIVEEEMA